MIYAGYKFEINQVGLFMSDIDDEKINLEDTPFSEGDVFILVRGNHGEMLFIKNEQLTQQTNRSHDQGL